MTQSTLLYPPQTVIWQALMVVDDLLRYPYRFVHELAHGINLPQKIQAMVICSLLFLASYGTLLGSTHSGAQMVSTAIKTPLLFLVTLLICAPTLYIINLLFGFNLTFSQSVSLVLMDITITATLLLSFAPVTLLFVLTVPETYASFVFLNFIFYSFASAIGGGFLYQAVKQIATSPKLPTKPLLFVWFIVYGFVGTQLAWRLRPFIGHPNEPFVLFRHLEGDVYTSIFELFRYMVGL